MFCHPVERFDEPRKPAATLIRQYFHSVECSTFGHPVAKAANGASNMGAMSLIVTSTEGIRWITLDSSIAENLKRGYCTGGAIRRIKVVMRCADASVCNIHMYTMPAIGMTIETTIQP
jgi:hypothetical protein